MDIRSIVLKLIGGNPLNKVRKVIADGLPIPNINDVGGLGALAQNVMANGAAGVFQNPLGGALGGLSASISGAVGTIGSLAGSVSGISGVTSALTGAGGLTDALSGLSGATDLLSGVASATDGQFGLLDVLSHAASVKDVFGDAVPSNLSLDTVLGPINSGDLLSSTKGFVDDLYNKLNNGTITSAAAITAINDYKTQINARVTASQAAVTTMTTAAQPLAQIGAIAGALISGPLDAQDFISSVIKPDAMALLQTAVNAHLAEGDATFLDPVTESDTL